MQRVMRTISTVAVVACAGLLGWIACSPKPVAHTELRKLADRQEAPDFALKDADGRIVHLNDYRGKVVLLDFWATWCGPCQVEIPYFTDFERAHKAQGFAVLGVAMDDDGWPTVKPFLKELSVNYRVVMGDDKTSQLYGGLDALPTTYLIDRQGRVASTHIGLTSKKVFENAIEQLLRDRPSAASVRVSAPGARAQTHGV